MTEPTLVADLTTSATISGHILGHDMAPPIPTSGSSSGHNPAAQVRHTGSATGDFEVELQGGFMIDGTIAWGEVATIDQTDVNKPITFPFSTKLYYRFKHNSGADVTCAVG